MTRVLGVPRAILNSRRRFWKMNSADDRPRKALGKGLSALLPGRGQPGTTAAATAPASTPASAKPGTLPLGLIQPNPMQPRTSFNADGLEELAASIRAN